LFQIDIAFQNIGEIDHNYNYIIVDYESEHPYLLSTEFPYQDANYHEKSFEHFDDILIKLDHNEVGIQKIQVDKKTYLIDYRTIGNLDVGLLTYGDIDYYFILQRMAYIFVILLSFIISFLFASSIYLRIKIKDSNNEVTSEIISQQYKFKNHSVWTFDLKSNKFDIDSTIIECLGYDDNVKIDSLDDYYKLIHPDDLKLLKYQMNDLMFNKLEILSVCYRIKGLLDAYIIFSEGIVVKRDDEGYPLQIHGMNIFLDNNNITWKRSSDE